MESKELCLQFTHGVGDCIQFIHLIQLYKKYGFNCKVHYSQDKKFLFDMCGVEYCDKNISTYHDWSHAHGFNCPSIECDGFGNKLFDVLNKPPLPYLDEPQYMWNSLCAAQLEIVPTYNGDVIQKINNLLKNLSHPIILLHTQGNSFPQSKNISKDIVLELYKFLLQGCDGTIILLDWDNRVPELVHSRIRHLKKDWGHFSLEELYYLFLQADVIQGIDSGPYHFATSFTDIPTIGVFTNHYPSCVVLPKNTSFNIILQNNNYKEINIKNRKKWNIGEYNNSAKEIGTHILRAIDGPRYLRNKQRIGRDLQLQYWIRDILCNSTGFASYVDRNKTFDYLFKEITKRFTDPCIVETGCVRCHEDWSAGYSTYLFGAYLDGLGIGCLYSIDNNQQHCQIAEKMTEPWKEYVHIICSDSIIWLSNRNEPIDVLYLDSLDTTALNHTEHGLKEIQAAEHLLHIDSIVVYDDTTWDHGWIGKGSLGVPYLLNKGWKIISSGYQVILARA